MNMPPPKFADEADRKPIAYILDDDREVCALLSRMLSAAGLTPIAFNDAADCMQQLKAAGAYETPTTIILDLSLGKSDAVEVIDQLKLLKYKGKVLLISGADEATLSEIRKAGFARGLAMLPILKKPFRLNDLKGVLSAEPIVKDDAVRAAAAPTVSLERAIADNALELRYQMKVNLKSTITVGAEAILYTKSATGGLVSVTEHLPAANNALYHPLSRILIQRMMTDWLQYFAGFQPPVKLLVKLPMSVVAAPGFIPLIRKFLPAAPKFPGLVIELIDWSMSDADKTIRQIGAQLKLYRVGLSTSDVASIHSSIAEVKNFPFEEFRLAPNFVSNCSSNDSKKELCKTIIDLAHSVGTSVCAGGVANVDELRTLSDLGCDSAQGPVFGRTQSANLLKTSLHRPNKQDSAEANAAIDSDPYAWPAENVSI